MHRGPRTLEDLLQGDDEIGQNLGQVRSSGERDTELERSRRDAISMKHRATVLYRNHTLFSRTVSTLDQNPIRGAGEPDCQTRKENTDGEGDETGGGRNDTNIFAARRLGDFDAATSIWISNRGPGASA